MTNTNGDPGAIGIGHIIIISSKGEMIDNIKKYSANCKGEVMKTKNMNKWQIHISLSLAVSSTSMQQIPVFLTGRYISFQTCYTGQKPKPFILHRNQDYE